MPLFARPEVRAGAAHVYERHLAVARFREPCEAALREFFHDADAAVREAAGRAIWRLSDDEVAVFVALCEAFLRSPAFVDDPDNLLHPLKETTARVPDLVLRTCEAILSRWASAGRVGSLGHSCSEALQLVLRAYADASDPTEKSRALDLIDRALEHGLYGFDTELRTHDRGWL